MTVTTMIRTMVRTVSLHRVGSGIHVHAFTRFLYGEIGIESATPLRPEPHQAIAQLTKSMNRQNIGIRNLAGYLMEPAQSSALMSKESVIPTFFALKTLWKKVHLA
ncbi:MAG: hypothetical protein F6K42_18450 [Leptolyngbya sp. SIO1D8]|nr:hypothetical protein [Leptolyngbya sp. SIO1D8]